MSEDLLVVQSCSCNDAVLNSADLIDWDEDSIQCGAWLLYSPKTFMHLRLPPDILLRSVKTATATHSCHFVPQKHIAQFTIYNCTCVILCSCKGHTGLRCLRPREESVQSMRELGACDTSQSNFGENSLPACFGAAWHYLLHMHNYVYVLVQQLGKVNEDEGLQCAHYLR